ncbi:YmfQ family protein [Lonsdalea britannica]|uniref:YmfQ family protein n=1 Tax=Lonsdalea britannica TaxID=1082704 RepID=UPI0026EC1F2D|nr:putative phage tail protein [Lonsdalea britannica]
MNIPGLLSNLLPPVSYDAKGERITAELTAEGNVLQGAHDKSDEALNAITPFYSYGMLSDWERVLDITPVADSNYQQRLENVLAKITAVGGLSIPYFKRLANSLGYEITIEEPQPFRCGVNRCGDRLRIEDVMWTWQVNVKGASIRKYQFRTGVSVVGERLMTFGDPVIESLFADLKPAHTFCYFVYEERN